ncbi:hypothetical protein ACHAPT_010914 [Fusarium lateritium]
MPFDILQERPPPFIYKIPLNLIDNKQSIKKALDGVFGSVFYVWSVKDDYLVVLSDAPAPAPLELNLREGCFMRKEPKPEDRRPDERGGGQ